MANRTRFQIQAEVLVSMRVQEPGDMARWLQLGPIRMAERATVRQIDRIVAHDAVGHLRHVSGVHAIGIL